MTEVTMGGPCPEGSPPTPEWWQTQYNNLLAWANSRNLAGVAFSREFAMPDENTFAIKPIADLLDRWIACETQTVIDPFARNSKRATATNDLNPRTTAQYHLHAEEFLERYGSASVDVALFDPPYSPRQIAECYRMAKRKVTMVDTQNARLCKTVKDRLAQILCPGGIAICCGWNSGGMGVNRGFDLLELLLVNHGGAHNDTIVTVERKRRMLEQGVAK